MANLSDNLKLMDLALGEEGAFGYTNYGDLYDANLEFIEDALTEKSDITITTANVTLDDDQQRSIYLNLSGTLTGNRDLILKADQKGFWFVNNGTSGAFTVTVKPSGGTGVVVAQGSKTIVYSNGSAAIFIKDVAADISASSSKTTPVDADEFALIDSAASGILKRLTWANLKATLLAVFGSNGILARTAAGTFAARTITGTAGQITVADGDGVSANPTLSLPNDIAVPAVLTLPNTGLHILDSNASHDLIVTTSSNLTADRTLTIVTGDSDRTLDLTATTPGKFESALLHVADEKTTGTNGGASTAGTWVTRTLNTVRTNEISSASLSSNQISLPAGTYFIQARAPGGVAGGHKARLFNVTDTATILLGSSARVGTSSQSNTDSVINGRFTLSGTKTVRIEHNVNSADATTGFGQAVSASVAEIYTEAMIWKVA